jgi:predicted lipoprotein with Yx(FWY)xxD motif
MRRWLVFPTFLIALLLVLAACEMGQPGAPGAPVAETPAPVDLDTPTPDAAAEEDATETPDIADTEDMTDTNGLTETIEITDTVEITGTPGTPEADATPGTPEADATPGTPEAEEEEDDTTGAVMDGMVMLTNDPVHGDILTDGQGRALYLFTQDTPNTSTCTGACLQRWPPLTTTGTPQAGSGVDEGLLGVITRDDGTQQVTYNGWPLYYYADDQAPGDTTGHEVGDVWYLLTPEGEQVGG